MTKNKIVYAIGLGRIGLPMSALLATRGFTVHGIDPNKVEGRKIRANGFDPLEPLLEQTLKGALESQSLHVATHISHVKKHSEKPVLSLSGSSKATDREEPFLSSADNREEGMKKNSRLQFFRNVFLIAVPTLIDQSNRPDLSQLYLAIESIQSHLESEDLVIIESTCPIGTTEKVASDLKKSIPNLYVAHCPERVIPGNIFHELVHNDRVVGGVDEPSTLHATAFYESFILGRVFSTDSRTAEGVKLAENAYRDLNIAFANELSMIAEKKGVDIHELIQLANRHPRVQILTPGAGVGGHCIPIDPWYLVHSAPDLAELISTSRAVNEKKVRWIIEQVKENVRESQAKAIACFGLTYKANVPDTLESPALQIIEELEKVCEVLRVDPYVSKPYSPEEALAHADIAVGLVAHDQFLQIPSKHFSGKIILDFAGAFR
ncbi:MAG: UDP-N-acetyl-D-mannosamine dehydrogenase [Chlamydiae bacterium]|nr:UDP-N-acetyl-D-mannosamine dehydrogenase [Chlamydiota bacterium]